MSTSPVTPAPAPAPKSVLQSIEDELVNALKQREQAVATVHAIDGAIQAFRNMGARLKAEAEKAVAETEKLAAEAKTEASKALRYVEGDAAQVIEFAKKEL